VASLYHVLAGEPPVPDHGIWASVTTEAASGIIDGAERQTSERLGAEAFLAVPYLRVVGEDGARRLVVGQVRVGVTGDRTSVVLALEAMWSEAGGWHQEPELSIDLDDELVASLAEPAHPVSGDASTTAVIVAKAFAEASRNEVTKLRVLRHELERHLANLLAGRENITLRPLLSQIIELSVAFNRARDQARSAVRDGLWIWLWDNDTYQRNRGSLPPSPDEPPWARTHRAALRHGEAMAEQLAEEVALLHALLSSMSTFAVAQDSEAQQKFNLIVTVAAAGLGLPALILSLYGAQAFLPMNTFDRAWRALLPIAATALVASGVALHRMPGRAGLRHYVIALLLVLTLVIVLLFAGALAPVVLRS
jgi:hypothetical protein